MRKQHLLNAAYILGLLLVMTLTAGRAAWAGLVDVCTADTCTWEISVDGAPLMSGFYESDPVTGDIFLADPVSMVTPDFSVSITGMSGNIDPELIFGLGATNTSGADKTFAFAFSLPLGGLPVPITTFASLGTTLTASSTAPDGSGMVYPTLGVGKIVDSQDITFSPFATVDKGVDIGDVLTDPAGGAPTVRSETANGSINAGGPFDLMAVTVAFGLTDQTGVGFSGSVKQTFVPVPAAVWLFGSGLLGLVAVARRRKAS